MTRWRSLSSRSFACLPVLVGSSNASLDILLLLPAPNQAAVRITFCPRRQIGTNLFGSTHFRFPLVVHRKCNPDSNRKLLKTGALINDRNVDFSSIGEIPHKTIYGSAVMLYPLRPARDSLHFPGINRSTNNNTTRA